MFAVSKAPQYLAEASAAAARLRESTSPEQYAALWARAERLVGGLFTVEVRLEDEIQALVALREKFDPARAKQAILIVATWRLIEELANKWSGAPAAVPGVAGLRPSTSPAKEVAAA